MYTLSGTYTVALTVRETDGDSDTMTRTDYIIVSHVNLPPVSDPNGPYTGTEGISLTFDGSGSSDPEANIVSYSWDFGDGNTATGVNPVHTYNQNGTYTVNLTVTDGDSATDSNSTTATIEDTNPVADFTATPTGGSEPLTVDFTDNSTSYDGISAWEWDFNNDGTVDSTAQNPTHTYIGDGTYSVTLNVSEADGSSDTVTKVDYITVTNVNQPPTSDPNGPYTDTEGVSVTFDGSGSSDPDGSIDSYDWDFGDGNTGTGVNPVHAYTQDGTYTVTLEVTDNDGATDTDTTTATISDTDSVYDIFFLPPITTRNTFNLKNGRTLPIKFTVRDNVTGDFIYDDTVNLTITNSTGHLIDYFTNGKGTNNIRINPTEEHYIVNFHTKDYTLNVGEKYTIKVIFGNPNNLKGYEYCIFQICG